MSGPRPEATLPQLESDDFVECYQVHYPRLVRALALAGAPPPVAEDVAQEAFARMLSHWNRVRSGASPAGYAYRTAFRLLSRSRRSRRAVDASSDERRPVGHMPWAETGGSDSPSHGQQTAGPEGAVTTRITVAAALASMPARRRACAVMCLVVGLSTGEAASALGIAEGTVRKHLGEARHDLRQVLNR